MNNLVLKLISFFFFNYNIPLVYNAFFQRSFEGCPRGGDRPTKPNKGTCFNALALNLGVIFLSKMAANTTADVVRPWALNQLAKIKRSKKAKEAGDAIPEESEAERQ